MKCIRGIDVHAKHVNWLNLKWLHYRKIATDNIFANKTYDKNSFTEMKVKTKLNKNVAKRP